ncbi:MAG: DUF4037 domain-containing protein [Mogibacterium sp.]|nr:DUF4037 domain-containing protein [Mogibacterium sp.]
MTSPLDRSRLFYEQEVAPMIEALFPEYANKIAVGVAGEGSDCFGYDDLISRDHDFGTGVCLWVNDATYARIGAALSIAYNELVDRHPGSAALSARQRERRGVMTIRAFYSNVLGIDCDPDARALTEEQWFALDHTCLATATNGAVFRDDLGQFTRFRNLLLAYYPDRIWKVRMINELHLYASAVQVNYARCITRGDIVAAEVCRLRGLTAAMELAFLLARRYAPYYKWTYRALTELPGMEALAAHMKDLATAVPDGSLWAGRAYDGDVLNTADPVITAAEAVAADIVQKLKEAGLTTETDPYLEVQCNALQRLL